MRLIRTAALLAAALLALGLAPAEAKPLKLIVFPGGFNLPIWIAQEQGLFARENIELEVVPTPNSTTQMKGLIDGAYDVALTAMDNVVAYRAGMGAVKTDREPDIAAVMGLDSGFLAAVGRPDVANLEALRGRKIAVDARSTGYAFVLYEMLARRGVGMDDVTIESAGGAVQRWEALKRGAQDATLLISPFDLVAAAEGFPTLARADQELAPTRASSRRCGAIGRKRTATRSTASSAPRRAASGRSPTPRTAKSPRRCLCGTPP